MTTEQINNLKTGEVVGFSGILSTETRTGKFVKKINEYLVEIDYGNHREQNHIANIYKPNQALTTDEERIKNLK